MAIIGSGPAGLAAAQQINRAGHETVVFEKDDRIGGLFATAFPISSWKSGSSTAAWRRWSPKACIRAGVDAGSDITAAELRNQFDAVCLCMGAGHAAAAERDRVQPTAAYISRWTSSPAEPPPRRAGARSATLPLPLTANGKHVIVVGGGDTGSDCVGTSIRQGAISVTQLEILPRPPDGGNDETPWPQWPRIMRTSSSQEEGCLAPLERI